MNAAHQTRSETWQSAGQAGPEVVQRLNRAIGPLMAGMLIDLFDVVTLGPMGVFLGVPIGGFAGYWLGKCLGLSNRGCLGCAAAAAIYCSVPFTEFVPLGSLIGAYVRFMEGSPTAPAPQPQTIDGEVIGSRAVD